MNEATDNHATDALIEAIELAIAHAAGVQHVEHPTVDDALALIAAAGRAAEACAATQREAVQQARRSGVSWAAIGACLGISRQAAQQRFAVDDLDWPEAPGELVLHGATSFNEMQLLSEAGARGYQLVGFNINTLHLKHSPHPWEHRREVAWRNVRRQRDKLEAAGWIHVGSWFPFHYFKRARTP